MEKGAEKKAGRELKMPEPIDDKALHEALYSKKGVGAGVAARFKNIRDVWRKVDLAKAGKVNRQEVRQLFDNFGYNKKMADKFFDHVNEDGAAEIDYREFQTHFAPIVQGWSQLGQEDSFAKYRSASAPAGRVHRQEVK